MTYRVPVVNVPIPEGGGWRFDICASNAKILNINAQNTGIEERQVFVSHFFEVLQNIENQVAWFLAEQCKAEKGVRKDKRNKRRTAFVRGCLAPRASIGRGAQLIAGDSRKSNGLLCVRPSTIRRAESKWPLEMHAPTGCIACVHSQYGK